MQSKPMRLLFALVIAGAAGLFGYSLGHASSVSVSIPQQEVAAPAASSVRIIYSLDKKQNDKEIVALIAAAKKSIYFAMYEFTLKDIADALVAAKERGIAVYGVVDAGESSNSYDRPVISELTSAGIPVVTEKHADGNGIMHIKAIVTDSAYALGSYNWTGSATTENDELLEIGTDPALRQAYENVLKRLYTAYKGNAAASAAAPLSFGTIDYTEAPGHIGETGSVHGTLVDAYTSKTGTVFLDFCQSYKSCPFSGVIFADDAKRFGDLSGLAGQAVTLTGKISSYQGQSEMVLTNPSQILH